MNRRIIPMVAASAGMMVLILDGQTALAASREGLKLCLHTLIPSLLPFFVFSIMLTSSLNGRNLRLMEPLERLCRIPKGSGSLLAVGLLGGYPVGAQNISLAHRNGQISKSTAERMLAFCNNAGPSFLFGIVGCAFGDSVYPWLLWGIHIAAALAVGFLTPGGADHMEHTEKDLCISLSQALEKSIRVMATVCGWVMFFRLILGFLDRWFLWMLPASVQVILKGTLELSNGCVLLGQIPGTGLRFLIASVMLSLGGFCVAMQTRSVCESLSLRSYYRGKLTQTVISFLLAWAVQPLFPREERADMPSVLIIMASGWVIYSVIRINGRKNSSSIPAVFGV